MTRPKRTSAEKLADFCGKLPAYSTKRAARSAITALKLEPEDKKKATEALENHWAQKEPEPAKPTRVASLARALATARNLQEDAVVRLLEIVDDDSTSLTDEELTALLSMAMEHNVVTAFSGLFQLHGNRIIPRMLPLEKLAKTRNFFDFAFAIADAPKVQQSVIAGLMGLFPTQLEFRHSDPVQLESFERVALVVTKHVSPMTIGPYIVEYARLDFVSDWLEAQGMPRAGVAALGGRLISMYINEVLDVGTLVTFVKGYKPERALVERVVRTLLSVRQLGNALRIAHVAPVAMRASLYNLLHPVVVQYGDMDALLMFAAVFGRRVDRAEIKRLADERSEVNIHTGIDALIDNVTPFDYFESNTSDVA